MSSVEAKYKAMVSTAAELTWLSTLLRDLGFSLLTTPILHWDNISALYLSVNPILHA